MSNDRTNVLPRIQQFINAGARVLNRNRENECLFRLVQEGLPSIYPYIKRENIIHISFDDVKTLLARDGIPLEELSQELRQSIEPRPLGSCILLYKTFVEDAGEKHEITVPICAWRGKTSLSLYIAKTERIHFQRICGIDTRELESEERDEFLSRQERKAQRVAQKLNATAVDGTTDQTNSEIDLGANGETLLKSETLSDKNGQST